jgi:hypothetical protein
MALHNSVRGQVSLESLLIWAALAGALALFTPAFMHLVQADALQQQAVALHAHAQQLESIFSELAFQSPGSKIDFAWGDSANQEFSSSGNELELRLVHASLQNPKTFTAHSPLPLFSSIHPPFSFLVISRTDSGITIESR